MKLSIKERFVPAQRLVAGRLPCPTCSAQPEQPCHFVWRPDRKGQQMPGFHVERYPEEKQ